MKKYFFMLIIIASLLLQGCLTMSGISSSTTPLVNKKIETNAGKTEGSDGAISILGLWMIGRPDIGSAIEEAKKKKNADALINVRWHEKTNYFLLFSYTIVTVEGDAVRFKKGK